MSDVLYIGRIIVAVFVLAGIVLVSQHGPREYRILMAYKGVCEKAGYSYTKCLRGYYHSYVKHWRELRGETEGSGPGYKEIK